MLVKARTLFPVIFLLGSVLWATVALAEDHEKKAEPGDENTSKALAVVEAADAATKKVHAATFHGRMTPTGMALNFVQAAEGQGMMSGWNADLELPGKFYGVAETAREGGKVKLEGGGDGETFYIIDHGTKKGYQDMDPGVMGTIGNSLRGIGLLELVHEAPFADELQSELTHQGTEEVGGVLCDKIHVVYAGGRGESTWYFSQEDHLPRKRVRHFKTPQGEGAIEIMISDLKINPEIDDSKFKMSLPEGYESVDDFAP